MPDLKSCEKLQQNNRRFSKPRLLFGTVYCLFQDACTIQKDNFSTIFVIHNIQSVKNASGPRCSQLGLTANISQENNYKAVLVKFEECI
jgi:hypothetical protein